MSTTDVQRPPRWKPAALWTLKGLLAAAFLSAGGAKILGVPMMVENFQQIGLGQWFRYLTGVLEIVGAIMVLMPRVAAIGGLLLSCIMVGAIATHLLLMGGSAVPAIVLLVLSAIVVFAHRDQIDSLFDRYDT
ncbi:putative membrane protein YphA (DoxX/SURF4 family) [Afipia massiliensis]|uniref:Putative membrane protein YphA (DoxX/SURF4 family) n=1 Tax=Afipia massiliensis TaxID=211460 RepID=A0A840MVK3_9BRAD|nr:DoxX family protein [Afipia massiliensis]MBB5052369.1 putative membrane protein YphA (DoxX/SURF4 family) [Afipia massiliensis]